MNLIKSLLASTALLLAVPQLAQAEILVGFVTGLSGPVSSIGIPNAKGIAAGEAYVGEIGGEKVRVIQLDDASDATASARNARKLVEQEKVDILIGTSGAPQTLAMATAAIEMKVPMIAVSPIAPVPPGDGGPWVVQTPQPTPLLVQGIVDHMKAKGLKTVAFIGFSDAFGDLMYNSLEQSVKTTDIKIIANERYARSDSSVTAQVLRALAARPDAIMLGGTGTPGALPVIALSERGYKGPLYGNHGLISADFLRLAGKAANGIICPTGPVTAAEQLPSGNPIQNVALDFRSAFEKANGEAPTDSFRPIPSTAGSCSPMPPSARWQPVPSPARRNSAPRFVRRCSRPRRSSGRRASTPIRRRIGTASTIARASWSRSRTASTSCCPETGA
ncbi:ABC transporter substrate-binding protein [Bradyrhizobium barranii subsp. barranii]|uniref:ABC transporter substrate-binding protein n=1 Tax=Bradyrhizobium barranii subsp. barranii TaxID=2823807 RepID=A0A9X9Y8T5_9BRAD|nr:ABC transporter substrate-binding protein [Bradyrhizobium barranii]UEM16329.1 ABC transporter substrate-binding protein [Bradyrhizobium barranii subsp. barranii]